MTGYIYKVNDFGTWNIKIFKDYYSVPVLQTKLKHSNLLKEKKNIKKISFFKKLIKNLNMFIIMYLCIFTMLNYDK